MSRLDATHNIRLAPPGPRAQSPWWRSAVLPEYWTPALVLLIAVLLTVSLSVNVVTHGLGADFRGLGSLGRWFDVDREMGVPAWLSTVLLVLCAQALWGLARQSVAGARRRWSRHERLLAVVFVFLSIDEHTQIHEQTITPLRQAFDLDGALTFAWVLVALPAVAVLGLFMLGYLRALPSATRWPFVLSGLLYVGGAAGVELVGSSIWSSGGADTVLYAAVTTLEEGLEMLALVLFLGVLASLRRSTAQDARVLA